jgi:hypothetical protein
MVAGQHEWATQTVRSGGKARGSFSFLFELDLHILVHRQDGLSVLPHDAEYSSFRERRLFTAAEEEQPEDPESSSSCCVILLYHSSVVIGTSYTRYHRKQQRLFGDKPEEHLAPRLLIDTIT